MKKIILIIALIVLLPSVVVMATDVSQAQYITVMIAINAAASTKTNVATTVNLSSPDMVSSGMIAATVDDAALISSAVDIPFMPGYDTNPWVFFVDSIPASSSENYYLYTGGATGGKLSYFPNTGGMTTSDHASLELGDNFTITLLDVCINTTAGADKYIFYKAAAIGVYIDPSTSEKVTAAIYEYDDSATWQSPTGATGAEWTDHAKVYDESTATGAYDNIPISDWSGYLTMTATSVATDRVRTYCRNNADITQIDVDVFYNDGWHDIYSGAKTQGNWQTHPIGTFETVSQARIRLYNNDGGEGNTGYFDEFDFNQASSVILVSTSVTGITSGEYDIIVSADETDLEIDVSGTSNSTALAGASVLDTDNDIVSFENDTVLYAGSQNITVDGSLKQFVKWEYGTTFNDSSVNNNDATPTFRTTGSDADVTVSIYSQSSTDEQGMPPVAETGGFTMIGDTPTTPSGLFDSGGTTFPGSAQIADLATATRISYAAWCYIFAFLSAILAGIGVFGLTHRIKAGIRGSMLLMMITMVVVLCFWIFGGGGVISGFVLIPFVLIMLFLLMLRNPQSPVVG